MAERTVIHVVLTEHFAGVERHIGDLSAALRPFGWRVVVAAGDRAPEAALRHYRGSGADVVSIRGSGPIAAGMDIRRLAGETGADIIHAHLGNAMVAATLGSGGRPVVVTQHFVVPRHAESPLAWVKVPVYSFVLRRASAVIAVSEAVRSAMGGKPRVVTIPHGVPDVGGQPSAESPVRRPALLFVGRMSAEKGPFLAIESAAAAGGAWEFWMSGVGDLEVEVRALGEKLLGPRFRFLGFTDDVDRLYRQAQALLITSDAESFGLVAVEAMRAAIPVIATAAGALPELVDDTVGRLVATRDPAAVAGAINELMSAPRLAEQLGRAGRSRFLNMFRAERMGERTAEVYRDVLR